MGTLMSHIAFWQFFAGLGFFLYGMNMLEAVLKNLSGRRIKFFLKRNTQNLFKAIIGGTLITGIVQSSSVVSLIVLAFVEAGIVSFRNALAVMLGANLGTTLDSWLVTFVGFKLDILEYAFPVIAVTAIGMFFLERRKKLRNFLAVFFALGLLFMGLDNMKQGASVLVQDFNIAHYAEYSLLFFILIGFVVTTIITTTLSKNVELRNCN
jgi:phosphate:Na+ symporter